MALITPEYDKENRIEVEKNGEQTNSLTVNSKIYHS